MGRLLEVLDLHVHFGGVAALSGVSLEVTGGEILGLIGPNGAGKSTLLNVLSRLVQPLRGRVAFRGADLVAVRPHRVIGLGIARTFQNLALFTSMTVLENVLVGQHPARRSGVLGDLWGSPRARESECALRRAADEVLGLLELRHLAGQRVLDLAYGHQKLVEMARALVGHPALLLLDEPAAGLNSAEKDELVACIRRMRDTTECAIVVVEHDMDMVRQLCERITVLSFGRNIAAGSPDQVLAHPEVIRTYLGSAYGPV